jgi:hypothetical protein
MQAVSKVLACRLRISGSIFAYKLLQKRRWIIPDYTASNCRSWYCSQRPLWGPEMFDLMRHMAVLSGGSIVEWTASKSNELAACSMLISFFAHSLTLHT